MPDWSDLLLYSYVLCASFQILYMGIQFVWLMRWKSGSNHAHPPLSVIVCARNEEENLSKLVPLLLDQNYPEFEVIVVLDRCADESLALMKKFEGKHAKIRTVIVDELPDHFSPKKYALTLGIKGACNDWVVLTDADCRPVSRDWLTHISREMDETVDFVLGYSPYFQSSGLLGSYISYETFLTAFEYLSLAQMHIPYMGVGRNIAYRKSLFLQVNGFNRYQGIMGGDDDLFVHHHAVGSRTKISLRPDSRTKSKAKTTWKRYWVQKKRHFSVGRYYSFSIKNNALY